MHDWLIIFLPFSPSPWHYYPTCKHLHCNTSKKATTWDSKVKRYWWNVFKTVLRQSYVYLKRSRCQTLIVWRGLHPTLVASNIYSVVLWNSWRDIEGRGKNCEGRTARGDQRGENCEGQTARVRGEGERWEVRGEKWVATARCEKRTLIVPRPLDTYGTFDAL